MAGAEIPNGWSALHWAAWRGDFHWLEQLLASAAAVDEKTIDGNTALFLAAYKGHKSIVQKLLIHKSDPSTACDLGEAPLHQSSYEGHTETIGLLIEAGADVNARSDNGTTPLHLAASNGQLASISLLLDAGASVFAIDEDGSTPGMIADENCYRDAAVILREQRSTFEKPDDETSSGQHIDFDPAMASIFPLEPASIRVHPHGYGCTGKSYALEALTECGREKFFMKTCRHSAVLEGKNMPAFVRLSKLLTYLKASSPLCNICKLSNHHSVHVPLAMAGCSIPETTGY